LRRRNSTLLGQPSLERVLSLEKLYPHVCRTTARIETALLASPSDLQHRWCHINLHRGTQGAIDRRLHGVTQRVNVARFAVADSTLSSMSGSQDAKMWQYTTGPESPPSAVILSGFGNIDYGRMITETRAGIPTLRAFQIQRFVDRRRSIDTCPYMLCIYSGSTIHS
jgi:hypothetical protein